MMCSLLRAVAVLVASLFFSTSSYGEIRLDIGSSSVKWVFQNQSSDEQLPASVPGGVYTDLQKSGRLPKDLFQGYNDRDLLWVSKENWTYSADFGVNDDILNKSAINLVLYGVDTVADISLNGQLLAHVDNMFLRHVLPVNGILKTVNHLEVRFTSPIAAALQMYENQAARYEVPPGCTPPEYRGQCHVNHLRKMQASFSWDWGPAFPSMGLWKGVELEAFNTAIVRDATVETIPVNDTYWILNSDLYLESATPELNGFVSASFQFADGRVRTEKVRVTAVKDTTELKRRVSMQLSMADIDYWWPNGFYQQQLYKLTVSFEGNKGDPETSQKEMNIAFRTVELVQEELTPGVDGRTFYFKVNGVPIFAKGSNWIPGHVLPELGYDESYIRHILMSAKMSHQNMIRVWGGGVYESDIFYKVADEYGILVWQDMMFACAMYPTSPEFLASTAEEVRQQVRRLQYHPSIAVWAGNNENEAALRDNWYGTGNNYSLYKDDYVKLYVDNFQSIFSDADTTRSYAISSPSNGVESEWEGYIADNPYSSLYGDVHYYNYVNNPWDPTQYPDTRFASEYGFQGLPSIRSIVKVCDPSSQDFRHCMDERQHHPNGEMENVNMIKINLPLPDDDQSMEYYYTYAYYSQISQAMATKTETEKYRRDRSKLTSSNLGNTMGALYWQLNDVWQAPTWASIEFGGRWKMLQYFAQHFFSPVLVSPEKGADGSLKIFFVSDLFEDMTGVIYTLGLYSWSDFAPMSVAADTVTINKATSTLFTTVNSIDYLLSSAGCSARTCFLHFELSVNGSVLSTNDIYPTSFNDVTNLQNPTVTISNVRQVDSTTISLDLTSDRIAPFVWLETDVAGEFSNNGFLMLTPSMQVQFSNMGMPVSLDEFEKNLTVQSLKRTQPQRYIPESNDVAL